MAIEKLNKNNQQHIVAWMNKLSNDEQVQLAKQVESLNIEQVVDLYNNLNRFECIFHNYNPEGLYLWDVLEFEKQIYGFYEVIKLILVY